MLTDPVEIEIVARARQKNVRDPNRSRVPFENIFADFLEGAPLADATVLDLGPGQYDFGVLARAEGAECFAIDNDEAVIELGRHKRFPVVHGRIQDLDADTFGRRFDGLFCKFSINAFWYHDAPDAHADFVARLFSLLKPDGWAWIAPWNGAGRHAPSSLAATARTQERLMAEHGCIGHDLTPELARRYGVTGTVFNHALFVRNLTLPGALRGCAALF